MSELSTFSVCSNTQLHAGNQDVGIPEFRPWSETIFGSEGILLAQTVKPCFQCCHHYERSACQLVVRAITAARWSDLAQVEVSSQRLVDPSM